MKALRDLELEVFPDGGRRLMITCSNKSDIPLHESLSHLQYPWVGVLHQMNAKTVLQSN
jgi:hypothetical protein